MAPAETSNSPASGYLADYYQLSEDRVPKSYSVMFKEGHTVAKHLEFLGRSFEMFAMADNRGYSTENIDENLREQIRRDPGVKYIEDMPEVEDDWNDDDDKL